MNPFMAITDLLNIRNQLLSNIVSPEVTALLEVQERLKPALQANTFLEEHWQVMEKVQPAMAAAIDKIPESYTIKSSPILQKMFQVHEFVDATKLLEYYNMLNSIPTSIDDFVPPFSDRWIKFLSQTEYELEEVDSPDNEKTEGKQALIIDESQKIRQIISEIYQNNLQLLELQPRQFEELIAELLYKQGFKIELTKQTRDGGYDILAVLPIRSQAPQKWLVECKRWSEARKVGVEVVRSFKEVVQSENANRGLIVTTSYFSHDAEIKRLETPYLLDFRDKDAVMQWVIEYALANHSK